MAAAEARAVSAENDAKARTLLIEKLRHTIAKLRHAVAEHPEAHLEGWAGLMQGDAGRLQPPL